MYCPYCGERVIGELQGNVRACPHLLFVYVWGEEDLLLHIRPDIAERFLVATISSPEYQAHLEGEGSPLCQETKSALLRAGSLPPTSVASEVVACGQGSPDYLLRGELPDSTILRTHEGYYSGIKVGYAAPIGNELLDGKQ